MPGYEILLHKADGVLSIVMMVTAISDPDAKTQAKGMLKGKLAYARIWNETLEIAIVRRREDA